jgi:hypothetical protein
MPGGESCECKESKASQTAETKRSKQSFDDKETAIFFDWDDTLLASSFLWSKGLRLDSEMDSSDIDLSKQLFDLGSVVQFILERAVSFGKVYVVTNAETGWVQRSAEKFFPHVVPTLSKLEIVSARSTFESKYPDQPLKWKVCAFESRLKQFLSNGQLNSNIVSFGDSHVEREAIRTATRGFENNRTKNVKFAERPSIEQLKRQLELISNCLHYICGHDGDLDLQLTVTSSPPPVSSSASTSISTTRSPVSTADSTKTCRQEHSASLPQIPAPSDAMAEGS